MAWDENESQQMVNTLKMGYFKLRGKVTWQYKKNQQKLIYEAMPGEAWSNSG